MTSRDDVIGPKRIKKGQKSCFLTFLSTFCMKRYPYDPSMECWWKTRFGPKITFVIWRHQKRQKDPKRVKKGLKWWKIMFFIIFRQFLHEKVPLWPLYGILMENPFWDKNHFWPMTSSDDVIGLKRIKKGQKSCFLSFLSTFCMKRYPYDPSMESLWKPRFRPKITFGLWRHQKGQKVSKMV